jgi:hypothetical protein
MPYWLCIKHHRPAAASLAAIHGGMSFEPGHCSALKLNSLHVFRSGRPEKAMNLAVTISKRADDCPV